MRKIQKQQNEYLSSHKNQFKGLLKTKDQNDKNKIIKASKKYLIEKQQELIESLETEDFD